MKKEKPEVIDLIMPAFGILLAAGILTVFQPCGARDDGSWMSCHWAGRAVAGVAGGMVVLSLLRLFLGSGGKAGLDLALLALSVLAALFPGHLIDLCMMRGMRCHALMKPYAVILSGLIGLTALADFVLRRRTRKGHEA